MSHYYFGNHHRLRQRFVKRARFLLIFLGLLILIVAAGIIIDVIFLQKKSVQQVDSTIQTKEVVLPSSQVFRTAYYQFQASSSWSFVSSESTSNTFIYRSLDKNLVLQELDVYVNKPQMTTTPATYVMPIKIINNGLAPRDISENCRNGMPSPSIQPNPRLIIFDTVQVYCNPSGQDYTVQVGEANGTSVLRMKQPDGNTTSYQIFFKDVQVTPNPHELTTIVQSFQPR